MSRDPLIIGGGKAILYGSSLTLDLRKKSIGEKDSYEREEAVKIGVTVKKNHVMTNKFPYVKLDYYAKFGEGIDVYYEILEIALENGILAKSGSFIKVPDESGNPVVLNDGTKLQWQGAAKFIAYCKENSDFYEDIKNKVVNADIHFEELEGEELEEALAMNKTIDDIEDDKEL